MWSARGQARRGWLPGPPQTHQCWSCWCPSHQQRRMRIPLKKGLRCAALQVWDLSQQLAELKDEAAPSKDQGRIHKLAARQVRRGGRGRAAGCALVQASCGSPS